MEVKNCKTCGKQFLSETDNSYCRICNKKWYEKQGKIREQAENLKWQEQKEQERKLFEAKVQTYKPILMESVNPSAHTLYIIYCQPNKFRTQFVLLHDSKPVYRLQQQSIRRLAFVPPYSVFCSISFRCGGLSIERNQKPLAPEITLAVTHHDRQKQVEVKRSSRVNPHEIRLFSGCPYAVVK